MRPVANECMSTCRVSSRVLENVFGEAPERTELTASPDKYRITAGFTLGRPICYHCFLEWSLVSTPHFSS